MVVCLRKPGPRNQSHIQLNSEMIGTDGVVNPVWLGESVPQGFIHYRNNRSAGAGGIGPPVHYVGGFDLWCAGCTYKPEVPSSAWEVGSW